MKVLEITPLNQETDNPSWRVKLEGTDKPLWIFKQKPQFVAGYDVPDDKIKLSSKGSSYIWSYKAGYKQTEPKQEQSEQTEAKPRPVSSYGKHSIKDSETESSKRLALMETTRLYMHAVEAGIPFDKKQHTEIYNHCSKLIGVDSALVEAIKKEGGVENE